MGSLMQPLLSFLKNEDGPTAVEYALILSAILAACLLAVQTVGRVTQSSFEYSKQQIVSFMQSE
ncbi:MAG: hypothetical protein KatS3mg110_2126 [Pirellulaceae bacterium]|nr:MAG: hypothetical protein KatS3mg110_2126 [Pirellulaceae bacterium]